MIKLKKKYWENYIVTDSYNSYNNKRCRNYEEIDNKKEYKIKSTLYLYIVCKKSVKIISHIISYLENEAL